MISEAETIEWIPQNFLEPLDLNAVFANGEAPLEVDAGCGDGAFLIARAGRFPQRNFLGTERLFARTQKVCRKASRAMLKNVRLLRVETHYTVRYLLPRASVSKFHVSFPDPWPKRRHWQRRLVNSDFLNDVHAALIANGELRLTTDNRDYFEWMRNVAAAAHRNFEAVDWETDSDYPQTNFERRFRAEGLPIYRMLLRKT